MYAIASIERMHFERHDNHIEWP